MKFNYEPDSTDGLVLIDEYYFNDFNSDILCSFDIFLDYKGSTELICDFPDEKWEVVRARESAALKDFCNSGKMIVLLANKSIENCEIDFMDGECDADMFIKKISCYKNASKKTVFNNFLEFTGSNSK